MPRKLKVYQTSIGFFDQVVAVPSMKAALEIWGADSNLFHQGFASEVNDPKTVEAALDNPGVVLKRPVGTEQPFAVEASLPKSVIASASAKPRAGARKAIERSSGKDDAKARKASIAYERERKKREAVERREEAKRAKERDRRDAAVRKATAMLSSAKDEHEERAIQFQEERADLERREAVESADWDKQRHRLEAAVRKARE